MKQFNERLSVQADIRLGNRPTRKDIQRMRSLSPGGDRSPGDSGSPDMATSSLSLASHNPNEDEYELDEAAEQDIEELWYSIRLVQAEHSRVVLINLQVPRMPRGPGRRLAPC